MTGAMACPLHAAANQVAVSVKHRTKTERGGKKCFSERRMFSLTLEGRQNFFPIGFQRGFFLTTHQVNVELGHADASQLAKFFAVGVERTNQAEAVDHLVGYEFRMVAIDLAMLLVIVMALV